LTHQLFALLTHQDAAAAIDLGIANKRDTSSMKTIAIVTMTFLPATFLAALFAMPSLDWKGEKVISPRFWVYWAYTIPMTMLVFGVWLCITERQRLIRWLKMLRRPSLPKTN
jgi:Mg2+ and Co2+ transporter CorA